MLDYILYASTAFAIALLIWRKVSLVKRQVVEQNVIEELKQIAEYMKSGNSFETAIKEISEKASSNNSGFFKKVLTLSNNGLTIEQALTKTAEKTKNNTLIYVSEVISLTITSKGNVIQSLEKLSNKLWEINHLQKKIDEKASAALTTMQTVGILVMPGIFYFISSILSTEEFIIAVDMPMKIYLGVIMCIFCLMDYIIFRNLKESLFVFPTGITIYLIYIIKLGPLITGFFI
jgi:Flp pilus assembly protein TadB